jgi:hypothetical protein
MMAFFLRRNPDRRFGTKFVLLGTEDHGESEYGGWFLD